MTPGERWNNVFHFKPVDRIFNMEFGWWTDTLEKWHDEGLPSEIDTIEKGNAVRIEFGSLTYNRVLDEGLSNLKKMKLSEFISSMAIKLFNQ